jgi:pimeloyl-ACP methyl ester carboxylesterase
MMARSTLLLVPGLLCDEAVWTPQVQALQSTVDVIVADHGLCDSLPAMARAALERVPHDRPIALAGHSMGGRVAYEMVRMAPERISKLALLDTGYEPLGEGAVGENEKQKRHALLDIAKKQGMRAMGMQWARGMVHPDRLQDAELMNAIYDMIERKSVDQFAAQIRALLTRPDVIPLLPQIRCPTLVLCGEQDTWAPLSQHEEIAGLIPGSRLVSVPHCGHMSTMERPAEVTQALREWLLWL